MPSTEHTLQRKDKMDTLAKTLTIEAWANIIIQLNLDAISRHQAVNEMQRIWKYALEQDERERHDLDPDRSL